MTLRIQVENRASSWLRDWSRTQLPQERAESMRRVAGETLREVIREQPVETGRSRAAWESCLEQLGEASSAVGAVGNAAAIAEGRRLGRVVRHEQRDAALVQVTSGVEYVPLVEYGTRRMRPRAMVRRGLARVVLKIRRLLLSGE